VALVSGATGGIGTEVVRHLLRDGARVVACGRDRERLEHWSASLDASGSLTAAAFDLGIYRECEDAVSALRSTVGEPDILVNCAAAPVFGALSEISPPDWEMAVRTKLLGYIYLMRLLIPSMIDRGFGRVVNIAGQAAHLPRRGIAPSNAINAALINLTAGEGSWLKEHNVLMNVVSPGPVATQRVIRMNEVGQSTSGEPVSPAAVAAAVRALCDPGLVGVHSSVVRV
jgi:NAD(P)-dependent dehydrogenase (short-subunit alcohol dehydrogenase family)